MRDVLEDLERWWLAGDAVGMATVVATWRSAPRPAGAVLLVGPDGSAAGSVSGGCVEGAVYDLAATAARTGVPVRQRYGVSDDDAFAVGLTCGGTVDLFVERVDRATFPQLGGVVQGIRSGTPVAVATCVDAGAADPGRRLGRRIVVWGEHSEGTLGTDRLDAAVTDDARGLLAAGRSSTLRYGYDGQRRGDDLAVFVSAFAPQPRMIVFGAIDFAAAVARIGVLLNYRVTVCDARPIFATTRRFPEADEVVVDWPHRYLRAQAEAGRLDGRTVVCVLTHDPKFDAPLLEVALRLDLAYVGAMGSRRTAADRLARLRAAGLTDVELERLRSPIGLDLGARTPEETAVSIAAEIIAARWAGSGRPLHGLTGRIHADADQTPPDAR
ncbi:MAG TPA: XdhC/CoxI family protein [Micromonosporaceae bacterium]|nr:XdhC/CoxI family protein [Micromonosporaceae bacterium]